MILSTRTTTTVRRHKFPYRSVLLLYKKTLVYYNFSTDPYGNLWRRTERRILTAFGSCKRRGVDCGVRDVQTFHASIRQILSPPLPLSLLARLKSCRYSAGSSHSASINISYTFLLPWLLDFRHALVFDGCQMNQKSSPIPSS